MTEIEFIESIDASFPFDDKDEWRKLIHQSTKISDNASCMVLYEICSAANEIHQSALLNMVDEWQMVNTHPFKDELVNVVKGVINGDVLKDERAIELMERVSVYNDLYNALGILLFACSNTNDRITTVYERIIAQWQKV